MTKKKHKILPTEMLDAFKYEIASDFGIVPRNSDEESKLDDEAVNVDDDMGVDPDASSNNSCELDLLFSDCNTDYI